VTERPKVAPQPGDEYFMLMSFEGVPVVLAAEILGGIDRAARRAGYVAVFREETGFGTVYFRRPKDASDMTQFARESH
jgi:hypothetical protein